MSDFDKNKGEGGLDTFIHYSPIIIAVVAYLLSYNVFVTPASLERRFNEYNAHIEQKYATKSEFGHQQKQLEDILKKIDKIYDYIIDKK